jgi:hypothetical protein
MVIYVCNISDSLHEKDVTWQLPLGGKLSIIAMVEDARIYSNFIVACFPVLLSAQC